MSDQPAYIKRILELRDEGLSWSKIADKLNEEKILTPKGNTWTRENAYRQYQHKVRGVK